MGTWSIDWEAQAAGAYVKGASTIGAYGSPAVVAADRLLIAYLEPQTIVTTNKIQFSQSDPLSQFWDPPAYAQDAAGNVFMAAATPSLAVTGAGIVMAWAQQKDYSFAWSLFDPTSNTWSAQQPMQSGGQPFVTSSAVPAAPALASYMGDLHIVWWSTGPLMHSVLPAGSTQWSAPVALGVRPGSPPAPGNGWFTARPPALCAVGDQLLLVWAGTMVSQLQSAVYDPASGQWTGPMSVGPSCPAPPSVTAISDEQALVVFRTNTVAPGEFSQMLWNPSAAIPWIEGPALVFGDFTTNDAQSVAYTGANLILVFPSGVPQPPGIPSPVMVATGTDLPSADWMAYAYDHQFGGDFDRRTLSQIVMPGSHDAGMYIGGIGGLTQDQDFYGQMMGGVRYFDCRIASNLVALYFYHGSTITAYGAMLSNALASMQKYLQTAGRREVIILKFSERLSDDDYADLIGDLKAALGPWLFTNTTGQRLSDIPLSQFMSRGKSTVLPLMDTSKTTTEPGFYKFADAATQCPQGQRGDPTAGDLRVYDCFSDTTDCNLMVSDQLWKFSNYTGYCDPPYAAQKLVSDLYVVSWTLTPITNVRAYAAQANPVLLQNLSGLQRNGHPSPAAPAGQIPNVIYLDYYETAAVMDLCWTLNARFTIAAASASVKGAGA